MKLLAVYVYFADNTRDLLFVKPAFDVETWAKSREWAFKVLGVTRLYVEEVEAA